ncbi:MULTISPECIES: hypothetical protein [unclassified Streptomyces]|uniref:hypothetical protein n=1 Tax=unclassified Streptomyces TaxID=2593676 RepID=UPI0038146132
MICPHCRSPLLGKERTGGVCSRCGRAFALDPKVHGRGMHDSRIRRVVEKATDGGRLNVTVTQLWYLARTSNRFWPAAPASGRSPWVGGAAAVVLLGGLIALGVAVRGVPLGGLLWFAGLCVSGLLYVLAKGEPRRPPRGAGASVVPAEGDFRSLLRLRWSAVYGNLPPGIVDDRELLKGPGDPATNGDPAAGGEPDPAPEPVELLCPDPAVRCFLTANAIPRRLNLHLAAELGEVSATGPVVVLHDASVRGLQLLADARATTPRRVVVDAGLPVRAVMGNEKAVTLHEVPPARVLLDRPGWLRQLAERVPEEADWLLQGWYSPVAAVPPAVLESAVVRAVGEARAIPDDEARAAAAFGFLSWPRPSVPPMKDGD